MVKQLSRIIINGDFVIYGHLWIITLYDEGCCNLQMFAKILQNNQLSAEQQKTILKNIIQVNLKQNLPEVKLQLSHNYEQLKPILLKHHKYSLRIAFAIINWQTARDFIEGRREGAIFDLIVSIAQEGALNQEGEYIVMQLMKVFPDPWKCLVILSLVSEIISHRITNLDDYNWLLSGFIQLSASIIQSYLTTKNEKAQSNSDRAQKDLALINNCEEWVTRAYLTLFKNLKSPKTEGQKKSILSALSQIVGALYESEREGHLNVELLDRILSAASNYAFQSYRIEEIRDLFIARLKALKYDNPVKKVEIPARYSPQSYFQTEGICWLIDRYLQESKDFYSVQRQLDYSLLIYSEILPHAYKLKDTLTERIHRLLSQTFHSGEFEINYPIALLLFNIHQHKRQQFENISEKLGFNKDKTTKINRLKRLLRINIENLNVEKTQFVVSHLDEDSLSLKEALFLIKAVEFNFTNQDLGNLITTLFEKVAKSHGEQGRKVVTQILARERQAKRNVELCHQLSKIYSK